MQETLRVKREMLGTGTPLYSMYFLAHLLQAQGKLDEAIPLFDDELRW